MKRIPSIIRNNPLGVLLVALPFAILADLLHWSPVVVFALSAIAIIPLAGYIGAATEVLAAYTSPRIGGSAQCNLGQCSRANHHHHRHTGWIP